MHALLLNPSPGEISALAHFVANQKICFPKISWLTEFQPGWDDSGKMLGLEARPLVSNDQSESLAVFVNPSQDFAEGLCWQLAAKAFVFTEAMPRWAQRIKNGDFPEWAKTTNGDLIQVPMEIEILSFDELTPKIRAYLH